MRLTVYRFRCHIETKICDFPSLSITLITGTSGTGKSTLLEAIFWCLYGGMQHIYPTGTTGTKDQQVCVLLELPEAGGLYIRRRKPPEVLEVGVPSEGKYKVLVDDAAQAQIEALFGSKGLWLASSYISQGTRSPLVTLPSSEKFHLLHELTFGSGHALESNSPDFYIGRIDAELYNVKTYIADLTSRYNGALETYTVDLNRLSSVFITWADHPRTTTHLLELKQELAALEPAIKAKRAAFQAAREEEVRYAEVQTTFIKTTQQLSELKASLEPLEALFEEQKRLQSIRERIDLQMRLLKHIDELTRKQSALQVLPEHLTLADPQAKRLELEAIQRLYAEYASLQVQPQTREGELAKITVILQTHASQLELLATWEREAKDIQQATQTQLAAHKAECERLCAVYETQLQQQKQVLEHNRLLADAYQVKCREHALIKSQHARYESDMKVREVALKTKAVYEKNLESAKQQYAELAKWWESVYPNTDPQVKQREIHLLLDELSCPHCGGGVIYKEGKLNKGSTTPEARLEAQTALTKSRELIMSAQTLPALQATLDRHIVPREPDVPPALPTLVEPTYESVPMVTQPIFPPKPTPLTFRPSPVVNLTPAALATLKYRQERILALHTPTLPLSVVEGQLRSLNMVASHKEYSNQIATLTNQLNTETWSPTTEKKLAHVESKIAQQQGLLAQISMLEQTLKGLKLTPPTVASNVYKADVDTLEIQLKAMTDLVRAGEYVLQLTDQKTKLEETHKQIFQYAEYEGNLVQLKTVVAEVATSAMDEIVGDINRTANLILKDLFNDDIRIILATHRTLKTKDKTKREVNLQISHRGQVYDNPNHLSGGEQDRISLALLIALAKVNPSPILGLDEAMAALDAPLREKCLKALRLHVPHKTLIHVCHEIVEGFHDNIIRLS